MGVVVDQQWGGVDCLVRLLGSLCLRFLRQGEVQMGHGLVSGRDEASQPHEGLLSRHGGEIHTVINQGSTKRGLVLDW